MIKKHALMRMERNHQIVVSAKKGDQMPWGCTMAKKAEGEAVSVKVCLHLALPDSAAPS
jgi:hypothetical protein